MIKIEDLTGIPEDKRNKIIRCLDELLTFKDSQGNLSPVISGYNWYNELAKSDRIITFSNIHTSDAYMQAMLKDLERLGYASQSILEYIREKGGAFFWDPAYRIRDDKENLLPNLKIKDIRTNRYVNLMSYIKPLSEYLEFINCKGFLLAEDQGWELDMPFKSKGELVDLVNLFLMKSGEHIYDEKGEIVEESDEEKRLRNPWDDAYIIPVLIVGEKALKYADELPQFDQATKICLIEDNNEISFIIHKDIDRLRNLSHYEQLKKLGFSEEICLGNKPFLRDIDEIR